jgi:hypothetical protein
LNSFSHQYFTAFFIVSFQVQVVIQKIDETASQAFQATDSTAFFQTYKLALV